MRLLQYYKPNSYYANNLLQSVFEDGDRIFQSIFGQSLLGEDASLASNIYEDELGYYIEVRAPGVEKENIDLASENGFLTITVESKRENDEETNKVSRRFQLSKDADAEKISAAYKNGVLSIHIPKAEKASAHKIELR